MISYLFVAKAESKLFLKIELSANVYYLIFSLVGYKLFGLTGLGIAFALEYVVYFFQCYLIARNRYDFRFTNGFIKYYGLQLLLVIICLAIVMIFSGWLKYTLGCIVIALSCFVGVKGLNQRMNLLDFIKNKIVKK